MLVPNMRVNRRSVLFGAPFQLTGAVIVCVALPFIVTTWSLPLGWHELEARNTALASVVAILLGFWLHRSVSGLPGTRESSGILPSYLMAFGLILTLILMARIDYSRSILLLCFTITLSWFYLVYLITQRLATLLLGIVDGGRVDLLEDIDSISTVRLSLDDEPTGLNAITADLRYDHSDAWEARLADYVLAGIPVYHAKDLYESLTGRTDLEHLSENTFGALAPLGPFQTAKRLIDFLVAVPVILALAPFLLIIAVLVRFDSPGPALFKQERIGYRGRPFTVFKFRTMRVQPAEGSRGDRARYMTRAGDSRITRLGRILRRSRIDELPQVINVLRGEMSWIGPRPEASALSEWYEGDIPFYRYRHVVVPGITGWAQVSQGHVAEVSDVKTKLQYDFYYIRNFSVWLDLLIIAKTVKIMLTGFGAR